MGKFLSKYSDSESQNTSRSENPKINLDFLFSVELTKSGDLDWNFSKSQGIGSDSAFDIR